MNWNDNVNQRDGTHKTLEEYIKALLSEIVITLTPDTQVNIEGGDPTTLEDYIESVTDASQNLVHISGNETIEGSKTFRSQIRVIDSSDQEATIITPGRISAVNDLELGGNSINVDCNATITGELEVDENVTVGGSLNVNGS